MKNQKGITLITLILTIIIIIILASMGVYTGIEAYKTMKIQKFIAQMRVVQERINVICEDWKNWEKYNPDISVDPNNFNAYIEDKLKVSDTEKPKKATSSSQPEFDQIISGTETLLTGEDKIITNYYVFSSADLEKYLDLRSLDIDVIINFSTRTFVEKTGVESIDVDGNAKRYYILNELIEAQRLTATIIQNMNTVKKEEISDYYKYLNVGIRSNNGNSKTVFVESNVKIKDPIKKFEFSKEDVAKPEEVIKWENVEDYTDLSSELITTIKENGDYYFKITDNEDNVFYSKESINIELVNEPVLEIGMKPICFENGEIVSIDKEDPRWYNYSKDKKEWANAMFEDGSIYVWIPKFAYKIDNTDKSIQIKFLYETGDYVSGTNPLQTLSSDYEIHPAFCEKSITSTSSNYKNGEWDKKITGIWVAKFNANIYKLDGQDTVITTWGKEMTSVDDFERAVKVCREMETNYVYGIEDFADGKLKDDLTYEIDNNRIDFHLIKNSELGAVLYLGYSSYGNARNSIKDNNTRISGGSNIESNVFDIRKNATTTGNANGVYDLLTQKGFYVSAGLLQESDYSGNIESIGKYFTKYTNESSTNSVIGDGIYELKTFWNQDMENNYPNMDNPIFIRGNSITEMFSYKRTKARENEGYYVRPVIIIDK